MPIVYIVSKLSKNGLPRVVKTVNDIPAEDPFTLHWYMKKRVCDFWGWGTCYIARNHDFGESPGWKLVAKLHLSKKGISLMKVDSSHPVFPGAVPDRYAYWEKTPNIPRFLKIGVVNRVQRQPTASRIIKSLLANTMPKKMKARGKPGTWTWKLNFLFKDWRPEGN